MTELYITWRLKNPCVTELYITRRLKNPCVTELYIIWRLKTQCVTELYIKLPDVKEPGVWLKYILNDVEQLYASYWMSL